MRFAIVGNAASTLTNFRAPLIREIAGRGHSVFALAPDYDDASRTAIDDLGAEPIDFPLVRTGLNPLRDVRDRYTLQRILAGLTLDSALCFGIKPAIYGTLAAARAGIVARHVLVTGLGYAFTDGGAQSLKRQLVGRAARLLYRHALHQAHTVFMQNPDDAADFVRMGIVGRDKVVTVNGTGVELDKWQPAPPMLRPVTFLLAARMLHDKGVVEFVEAARRLKSRDNQIRFVLIGARDSNPQAISADQLEIWVNEGIVEWPGHSDMRAWLSKASVFVLPSYREGVPRSSLEAMALGRPIITTDAPGCRETVIRGYNGFLVPPKDSVALADMMQQFVDSPDLIRTMGMASRKLVEERFDITKVNKMMIETMGL